MTRKVKITGLPFKPELVRANKDGRKTVTRRGRGLQKVNECPDEWRRGSVSWAEEPDWNVQHSFVNLKTGDTVWLKCPYGQKGDILYVKETYRKYYMEDDNGNLNLEDEIIEYSADGGHEAIPLRDGDGFQIYNKDGSERYMPWKPAMFMPQSAARIWMEVVDSYPERIQDITREDAMAEGLIEWSPEGKPEEKYYGLTVADCWETNPVKTFERILVEINGQDMWDRNEWVWVIRYKILSTTGKPEGI